MPKAPDPPPLPPPPPTPPHFASAASTAQAYKTGQRGGIAGSILTSGQGAADYGSNTSGSKSLLGQ